MYLFPTSPLIFRPDIKCLLNNVDILHHLKINMSYTAILIAHNKKLFLVTPLLLFLPTGWSSQNPSVLLDTSLGLTMYHLPHLIYYQVLFLNLCPT